MPVPSIQLPTPWGFTRRQRTAERLEPTGESSVNPMFSLAESLESQVDAVDITESSTPFRTEPPSRSRPSTLKPSRFPQSTLKSGLMRFSLLPTPEAWHRRQRKMETQENDASKKAQVILINFRMPAFMFVSDHTRTKGGEKLVWRNSKNNLRRSLNAKNPTFDEGSGFSASTDAADDDIDIDPEYLANINAMGDGVGNERSEVETSAHDKESAYGGIDPEYLANIDAMGLGLGDVKESVTYNTLTAFDEHNFDSESDMEESASNSPFDNDNFGSESYTESAIEQSATIEAFDNDTNGSESGSENEREQSATIEAFDNDDTGSESGSESEREQSATIEAFDNDDDGSESGGESDNEQPETIGAFDDDDNASDDDEEPEMLAETFHDEEANAMVPFDDDENEQDDDGDGADRDSYNSSASDAQARELEMSDGESSFFDDQSALLNFNDTLTIPKNEESLDENKSYLSKIDSMGGSIPEDRSSLRSTESTEDMISRVSSHMQLELESSSEQPSESKSEDESEYSISGFEEGMNDDEADGEWETPSEDHEYLSSIGGMSQDGTMSTSLSPNDNGSTSDLTLSMSMSKSDNASPSNTRLSKTVRPSSDTHVLSAGTLFTVFTLNNSDGGDDRSSGSGRPRSNSMSALKSGAGSIEYDSDGTFNDNAGMFPDSFGDSSTDDNGSFAESNGSFSESNGSFSTSSHGSSVSRKSTDLSFSLSDYSANEANSSEQLELDWDESATLALGSETDTKSLKSNGNMSGGSENIGFEPRDMAFSSISGSEQDDEMYSEGDYTEGSLHGEESSELSFVSEGNESTSETSQSFKSQGGNGSFTDGSIYSEEQSDRSYVSEGDENRSDASRSFESGSYTEGSLYSDEQSDQSYVSEENENEFQHSNSLMSSGKDGSLLRGEGESAVSYMSEETSRSSSWMSGSGTDLDDESFGYSDTSYTAGESSASALDMSGRLEDHPPSFFDENEQERNNSSFTPHFDEFHNQSVLSLQPEREFAWSEASVNTRTNAPSLPARPQQ